MLGEFRFAGAQDAQRRPVGQREAARFGCRRFEVHHQAFLAAGHGQVDLGQQFRVQQGAVELPVRVVDAVLAAQRVERVALARAHVAGHLQRIDDAGADPVRTFHFGVAEQPEFVVEEFHVEAGVMDHQLGFADEVRQFGGDITELRFVGQEFVGQAVDALSLDRHFALGIDVAVQASPGRLAADEFDAADLDDAVAVPGIQAGGLGVEYDLAHFSFLFSVRCPGAPARRPARSRHGRHGP
jgi:hypothetical protein